MRTCPACRKMIDVEATKCPYCHTLFDAQAMRAGRDEVRGRRRRGLIALALAIVATFVWLSLPGNVERLSDAVAEAP